MNAPWEDYAAGRFDQAAALLPWALRQGADRLSKGDKARAEELRLRVGRPPSIVWPEGERPLPGLEKAVVQPGDLSLVLEVATQASVHTVLDRVRDGFVTVRGGHRVGLCGTAAVEEGEIRTLRQLSSLAIRVAREVPAAAADVLPQLLEGGKLQSTLLLSPPGGGKTTLLRDLIRRVSDGIGAAPLRVAVADERGELAAMYGGAPQNDLGARTDILDGCPKGPALLMLLRAMNPQVLAADEITAPADAEALAQAAGCGVKLLGTIHGGTRADLLRRPVCRRLVEEGLFQRVVLIRVQEGRRVCQVERMEEILC